MRKDDRSFAALLLVEGLAEAPVRDALWRLRSREPGDTEGSEQLSLYTVVFSLGAS